MVVAVGGTPMPTVDVSEPAETTVVALGESAMAMEDALAVSPVQERVMLPMVLALPLTFACALIPVQVPPPVGRLNVTVLSVLVDAVFGFPATSFAAPAPIYAITVPVCVIPLTATL